MCDIILYEHKDTVWKSRQIKEREERNMTKNTETSNCLTLRVEECADLLGICRSAAYNLVRQAESSKGKPFQVIRIGNSLLISRKSFQEFLETNGLM